ncbi:MAG: bis(5'-nucleosyl)-tetraphosphatase (symmetrical) YqeK [Spirochaetia bacterium]
MSEKYPVTSMQVYLSYHLTQKRFAHSVRTAEYMRTLCENYGFSISQGYFAGLCHDIARDMRKKVLKDLSARDGQKIRKWEDQDPVLLHGRAGAVLLGEYFGIADMEILDAVRYHTYGAPQMGNLAKLLFIADYTEPGRKHVDEGFGNGVLQNSIDKNVRTILEKTFAHLEENDNIPVKPSQDLLKILKQE